MSNVTIIDPEKEPLSESASSSKRAKASSHLSGDRSTKQIEGEGEFLAQRLDAARKARREHEERRATLDECQRSGDYTKVDFGALEIAEGTPVEELTWSLLDRLAEASAAACAEKWTQMKAQARREFAAGGPAASVVGADSPWKRAQFLAIRASFVEEWRPRGGVEVALIDQAAVAYRAWMQWQERATRLAGDVDREEMRQRRVLEGAYEREQPGEFGLYRFEELRRRESEAADMADRYQRAFVRAVRALRDLRRYAGAVHIHSNQGQVNIGEQRVNVEEGGVKR
jgi:hypothetical protein